MNLPEVSVRRPVTTLMVLLAVLLVGVFCLVQMPIDQFPEMDIPVITVITAYEGAGPEDVEEKVTRPLEEELSTVEDVDHVFSTSREGISVIRLSFNWETDLDTRANDVRDAIDMAETYLPDEVQDSRIFKVDMSQFPVLIYGVRAEQSYGQLEDMLEDQVANPLQSIAGVASVSTIVPLERQVNVDLDRERLASYGLTVDDVSAVIAKENREESAGSVKMGETDYLPRVPGEFDDAELMNEIVLKAQDGHIIRLKDVGKATDSFKEVERYVTIDGKPGALLFISKQSDANTVGVARRARARLPKLAATLPPDVDVTLVMDGAEDIERIVRDLLQTLLLGGGLAVIAVFVFLRQLRSTFVIALAIPFSLVLSGAVMYAMDYTINMITLFALIVAIGMVVDNSIVVLENITRHREEGESASEGAVYGASEVPLAITASTLTTLCIFFPLLFVRGLTKIMFEPFAVVAAVVLTASLFSALTITPMLASKLLPQRLYAGQRRHPLYRLTEAAFEHLASAYSGLLGWSLRHRLLVVFAAVLLLAGSLSLVPAIGWEFMPKEDRALVRGTLRLPVGTRVETTHEAMGAVVDIVLQEIPHKDLRAAFARCGASSSSAGFQSSQGAHIIEFGAKVVEAGERDWSVFDMADRLRKRMESIAGIYSFEEITMSLQDAMSGLIAGGEQPLSVNIMGDSVEDTNRLAARIRTAIEQVPGAVDISISRDEGAPELWVNVDRDKASSMGLNVSDVVDAVRSSVYGRTASKFRVEGDEYDIFVRLREEDRSAAEDLGKLPVRLPSGEMIRVENIADVSYEQGPIEIERKDQTRIVRVEGDVTGRSLGAVIADVKGIIGGMDIPPGVDVVMGGQSEDIGESFMWLSIALVVGMMLVYMVMASQFESLLHPFVVMFSLPFAFVGVVLGLYLRGHNLNIVVFLGMLMLIGIVVNNAIVLVDYINLLRARGRDMADAIREAGRTRLRPVLMTAVTTILALAQMAFRTGQGAEVWNPLGMTILGGLLVSTLVTLVIVPVMYSLFETRTFKASKGRETA